MCRSRRAVYVFRWKQGHNVTSHVRGVQRQAGRATCTRALLPAGEPRVRVISSGRCQGEEIKSNTNAQAAARIPLKGANETREEKKNCLSRALILMRTLVASFFRVQCWRHEGTDAYARVLFPAYVVRYVDALGSSRLLFLICLFVFCFTIRISRFFFSSLHFCFYCSGWETNCAGLAAASRSAFCLELSLALRFFEMSFSNWRRPYRMP